MTRLRILSTAIALSTAIITATPYATAQRHQGADRNRSQTEQSSRKTPPKGQATRPNGGGSNYRPSTGANKPPQQNARPPQTTRPQQPQQRPPQNNVRPPQPPRPPQHNVRPPQPPRPPQHNVRPPQPPRPMPVAPPQRPGRPPLRPYQRPVPPIGWRPAYHGPSFASILGLTFGTALNISINMLNNNGYTVDGYGDNVVYLRNINQFGYNWPDATLFYGPGGLVGSQFLYSTAGRDPYRYNVTYRQLVNQYGMPTTTTSSAGGMCATWFGPSSNYIQLEFKPMVSNSGATRFYTVLQFGN